MAFRNHRGLAADALRDELNTQVGLCAITCWAGRHQVAGGQQLQLLGGDLEDYDASVALWTDRWQTQHFIQPEDRPVSLHHVTVTVTSGTHPCRVRRQQRQPLRVDAATAQWLIGNNIAAPANPLHPPNNRRRTLPKRGHQGSYYSLQAVSALPPVLPAARWARWWAQNVPSWN